MASKRRENVFRILVPVLACVVAVIVMETAIRAVLWAKSLDQFDPATFKEKPLPADRDLTLGEIIRVSEHERIIYELKPNLNVRFLDQALSSNSLGFRGGPPLRRTSNPFIRIVGLGDSIMFGWAVSADQNFLSLLEESLKLKYPFAEWSVINTAVPGYNTVMAVETLKLKGLNWCPDLVLIDFLPNDIRLPNFIWKNTDYLTLRRSFLLESLAPLVTTYHAAVNDGLVTAPLGDEVFPWGQEYEGDLHKVPTRYRDMVGWTAYAKAMKELRVIAEANGFKVVVTSAIGGLPKQAKDALDKIGLPYVQTYAQQKSWLKEHGYSKRSGSPLTISVTDNHPSVTGHQIIADAILEYLEKEGVVAELLLRSSVGYGGRNCAVP